MKEKKGAEGNERQKEERESEETENQRQFERQKEENLKDRRKQRSRESLSCKRLINEESELRVGKMEKRKAQLSEQESKILEKDQIAGSMSLVPC